MKNESTSIPDIKPVITEAYELLESTASTIEGISGLASGFKGLDRITSGWQKGDLIVFGSRPSMGKTALILSMTNNIALNCKIPVAIFSLEMTSAQLANRLIVNVCEIPGEKIKNGQLAPNEWMQLDNKLKNLYDAPIYIDDTPWMRIDDLCNKARELVNEKGVQIIFIDYLQRIYTEIKYIENRYSELNYFTRCLKSLAMELNIPIVVSSQLNRNVENRDGIEGKRPQLYDLRDSGTICDDADVICFIHRPEYYHIYTDEKGNDLRGLAEIIVAKQRNGFTGDIDLGFIKEFARFSNIEETIKLHEGNILTSKIINPFSEDTPLPF